MGPGAFASPQETQATVLQELYRLNTTEAGVTGAHSGKSATVESDVARAFADRIVQSGVMGPMTVKIDAQWRRWLEAAKTLAEDPKAAVSCPQCGEGTLQVIDAHQDALKLDRYMQCPVCHGHNVMTLYDPILADRDGNIQVPVRSERNEKQDAEFRRWLEAAKILAVDPKAAVTCPRCGEGSLQVSDARHGGSEHYRYMNCPVCHAVNGMTLKDSVQ